MKKKLYTGFFAAIIFLQPVCAQFPQVYDLRSMGYVSPVKDQGSCGSCWAFAAVASMESNALKNGYGLLQLSEDNLTDCHLFDEAPCAGGSFYMAAALLTRHAAPLSAADDPYTPSSGNCPLGLPVPPHPPAYWDEVIFLPPDVLTIKQALTDHGCVATSMFFTMSNYNAAKYKYYDALIDASDSLNAHCVTIAGWNDTLFFSGAPGPGGWIIKDSYGTSWAQNGFFYVSYYDAGILAENAVFTCRRAYPHADNKSSLYHYDTYGWVSNAGNSQDAFALAAFVIAPPSGAITAQQIKWVGSYTTAANCRLHAEIYSHKSGNALYGLLSASSRYCDHPGFYTLPVQLTSLNPGDSVYVKFRYECPAGVSSPIPVESYEAGHTSGVVLSQNLCWISNDGINWQQTGQGTSHSFDVCIKMYSENAPKALMNSLPDTICRGAQLVLISQTPAPYDSLLWFVDGQFAGYQPLCHHVCQQTGTTSVMLVAWLGNNSDTAQASVFVAWPDTSVAVTSSVLTSANPAGPWLWLDCGNNFNPVPGAVFQSFSPAVSGSFAVIVNTAGCSDTSACHQISISSTAEQARPENLVYPVCFSETVFLQLAAPARIRVFSVQGALIYDGIHPCGTSLIKPANLSDGLFILRLESDNNIEIFRLMRISAY